MSRTLLTSFFLLVFSIAVLAQIDEVSPYVDVYHATVESGAIETDSTDPKQVEVEVYHQLKFLIGALNGYGGGAALDSTLDVEIGDIRSGRATYKASVDIAWNRNNPIGTAYSVMVPANASATGLQAFFNRYHPSCSTNEDYGAGGFFYTYRPQSCQLGKATTAPLAQYLTFQLEKKESQLDARPEYDLIWQDGALNAIAIFGNTKSRDASVFLQYVQQWWGKPQKESLSSYGNFSVRNMNYRLRDGTMNLHVFEISNGNISTLGKAFADVYAQYSENADYVSFNGHSGMGRNVRTLSRIGKLKAGQYKLVFHNGCDSFSYVDGTLIDRHHALNPEAPATKYLDLITTALPSQFNQMPYGTARVLWGLASRQETFFQILSQIRNAHPIVLGETDNSN